MFFTSEKSAAIAPVAAAFLAAYEKGAKKQYRTGQLTEKPKDGNRSGTETAIFRQLHIKPGIFNGCQQDNQQQYGCFQRVFTHTVDEALGDRPEPRGCLARFYAKKQQHDKKNNEAGQKNQIVARRQNDVAYDKKDRDIEQVVVSVNEDNTRISGLISSFTHRVFWYICHFF